MGSKILFLEMVNLSNKASKKKEKFRPPWTRWLGTEFIPWRHGHGPPNVNMYKELLE
jgi:hypothetical protein